MDEAFLLILLLKRKSISSKQFALDCHGLGEIAYEKYDRILDISPKIINVILYRLKIQKICVMSL